MSTHVFTSIVANYLAKARVLASSVKRFHPDWCFHLVLSDAVPPWLQAEAEPFESVISVHDLGIENPRQWIFKHTLVELSTAVKGFALRKLLAVPGCSQVLYLDPDIVVLSSLEDLLERFRSASLLLTPHLTEPETSLEAIRDNEICVLQHGVFNLGFLGVRNSEEGRRFADWWADRLYHFCYDDIPHGLFTDQRWADLVPACFPDYQAVRDPIYNVCTWNLTHRKVEGSLRKGLTIQGRPIAFYHFSGLDSGAQAGMLDKYGRHMPALYELRKWYLAECDRMGQSEVAIIPWAYGDFDNGQPITTPHRRCYRDHADVQRAFPDPFSTADVNASYYHWFEAENRNPGSVDKRPTPSAGASPATTQYRIILLILAEDQPAAATSARRIYHRSYQTSNLFLAGSRRVLDALSAGGQVPPAFQSLPLDEAASYDEAFAAILRVCGDQDVLLVRPGIDTPEHWDLRLAWTSRRQPGIATVCPLVESGGPVALDPTGELLRLATNELLDRLCCHHSRFATPEIGALAADCLYIRADAIRAASSLSRVLRPGSFLDATQQLRYTHVLADHVYAGRVHEAGRVPAPRKALQVWGSPHEPAPAVVVKALRQEVRAHLLRREVAPPAVRSKMLSRNLHITHSWGGGLERWVSAYCRADREHDNFVLKAVGAWGGFGATLHLYRNIDDPEPVKTWRLDPIIKSTEACHAGYAAALAEIVEQHGIGRILVSSLIGHSLEALRQYLPTTLVCHDYYPFCPALNITFKNTCRSCTELELTACTQENPHHRFFRNQPPSAWLDLRPEFLRAVREYGAVLAAPAPSVRENYLQLLPELEPHFRVVPHGTRRLEGGALALSFESDRSLRILALGSLAPHKGGGLLEVILPQLQDFAELLLVGCGQYGRPFEGKRGVTVIPEYEWAELPGILDRLRPDLGLLASVVPETFSYTLQELFELAIPVLATRVGSFADRIEDGVNGFLCDPDPADLLRRLKALSEDRRALARVHDRLKDTPVRDLSEMLVDYERLHAEGPYSSRSYFRSSVAGAIAAEAHQEARLQLFWRPADREFREANSAVHVPLATPDRQVARFGIPALDRPPAQLRLDLSDRPGLLVLYRLCLHDHREQIVWSWEGDRTVIEKARCNQLLFLDTPAAEPGVLLYLDGHDPSLTLPPDDAALKRLRNGGMLEVEFALPPSEKYLAGLVQSAVAGKGVQSALEQQDLLIRQLTPGLVSAQAQTAAKSAQLERLMQQLQEAQARIADLEHSFSWRVTQPVRLAGRWVLRWARVFQHLRARQWTAR